MLRFLIFFVFSLSCMRLNAQAIQFTPRVGVYGDFFSLADGRVLFEGIDSSNHIDIWITDGSDLGTQRVYDVKPDTGSFAVLFLEEFDGNCIFQELRDTSKFFALKLNDLTVKTFSNLPGAIRAFQFRTVLNGSKLVFSTSQSVSGVSTMPELWAVAKTMNQPEKIASFPTGTLSLLVELLQPSRFLFRHQRNALWESDGTPTGLKSICRLDTTLRIMEVVANDNNDIFVFAMKLNGTLLYTFKAVNGSATLTDSIAMPLGLRATFEPIRIGNAMTVFTGYQIISMNLSNGKLSSVNAPLWGDTYILDNKLIECDGKYYFYGEASASNNATVLYRYNPTDGFNTQVLRRSEQQDAAEHPLCYGKTLVGEWGLGTGKNGVFVLRNGVDSLYFESQGSSTDVQISKNTLIWKGGGSVFNQKFHLWSLDLTTVPTTEPLPAQLDLSVYPTITTDGVFYLGGTDAQTDLMSAQLVNSAGSIIHVNTQVSRGEPLNFGSKAPGVYFVYLLSKDGRRFMQKVVYR
jgi:ELWxxDGT repeat protein